MTRLLQGMAFAIALVAAVGCGSGAAPQDGAAGGSGAGGGGGGTGGSGMASCPAAPPTSGASCGAGQTCFYEHCAGAGRTVAICAGAIWNIENGACTSVSCQGMTCAAGQICMMSAGGALLVSCVQNTCASGAIGCGCLQSCAGTCTVGGSLQSGVTINCNTCTSNQCA